MAVRAYVLIAGLWFGSLAAVGVLAQGTLRPEPKIPWGSQAEPKVVSGTDIGFRIDRTDRGVPSGRLVVRVNGQWVEANFAAGVSPAIK